MREGSQAGLIFGPQGEAQRPDDGKRWYSEGRCILFFPLGFRGLTGYTVFILCIQRGGSGGRDRKKSEKKLIQSLRTFRRAGLGVCNPLMFGHICKHMDANYEALVRC